MKIVSQNSKVVKREGRCLDVFSFKNLLKAYYACRKSKRRSASATEFEINFEQELLAMSFQLKSQNYRLGKYTCFAITDPKIREVWAADFRDRIVHHLLINYLEPTWEKKFIFHSYACRNNKGAHKAIKNLKKTINNQNPKKKLWYLKMDIESFFMHINRPILFSFIQKHINDSEILWLAKLIIFQNPTDNYLIKGDKKILASVPKNKSFFNAPPEQALPIGNYTSQFFANVYLNEADQFIKHSLKCPHYFRYMDDFLLLSEDEELLLKWQKEISNFLENQLRLKLHPKKQFLQPVACGIDFLGYVVKPDYALSRRRVVANFKKKLHRFNKILDKDAKPWPEKRNRQSDLPLVFYDRIPPLEFIQETQAVINSYYGHFKHAECFYLRKNLYQNYFKELNNFLEPADKTFSSFIIKPAIKKFIKKKMKNINGRNTARKR